jgi:transposase
LQVIAPLLPPQLSRGERRRRLDQILAQPPQPPDGSAPARLTRRTVQRWLSQYQQALGASDPLAALEPRPRRDRGRSRRVPPELLAQVIALRERASRLSVKEILKRIDHEQKNRVSRRSVSRALRAAGYDRRDKRTRIATRSRGPSFVPDWDLEAWEADFPNEVWQLDSTPSIWLGKSPTRERPVQLQLVNLLDDHSRLVVGGGFVERLRVTDLLALLVPAIARYGCPVLLYVDQAKVHKASAVFMLLTTREIACWATTWPGNHVTVST